VLCLPKGEDVHETSICKSYRIAQGNVPSRCPCMRLRPCQSLSTRPSAASIAFCEVHLEMLLRLWRSRCGANVDGGAIRCGAQPEERQAHYQGRVARC